MKDTHKDSFDSLEATQLVEIEVQAELLKQKEILRQQLELDNQKHMDAIMQNMSKTKMYDLDNVNYNKNKHTDCSMQQAYQQEKESFLKMMTKTKEKIMIALLVVVVVLLAVGVTPSGEWYEALQTNYVETIVDIFKVGMIGLAGYLLYKLVRKEK